MTVNALGTTNLCVILRENDTEGLYLDFWYSMNQIRLGASPDGIGWPDMENATLVNGTVAFQQDQTYNVRIVMEPEKIVYYIDDQLMTVTLGSAGGYAASEYTTAKKITDGKAGFIAQNASPDVTLSNIKLKKEQSAEPALNGFVVGDDGALRFYENDEAQYAGVVEYESNLYYINSTCAAVRNRTNYYVTKTNGLVEAGYYDFDANGVMTASAGTAIGTNLYPDPDGEIRYYDGEATYAGVVADSEGNLYYVNSTKKAVKDTTYFITKTNGLLPAGNYVIGADGRINVGELGGNFIVDADGDIRYFENGEAQYAGVVQDSAGNYYYINSTKKAVRSQTYFVTKTNGLIPAAEYTIGADGRIVIE
jgi:hypothetical protein